MVNKNIIEYKDYKGKCLYDERTDKFFKSLEKIKTTFELANLLFNEIIMQDKIGGIENE